MKRRTFLKGLGAAAAASTIKAPALAQGAKARSLILSPVGALATVDPHFSTSQPSFNHGQYAYDTLYGLDEGYAAKPQMAEGHTVSSDQLTWDIKLRPGLKFHDGERVLAKDCAASIKRWGQRDGYGQALLARANDISAADDNTLRIRLKSPFNLIPTVLGHPVANACTIMPERFASKPITNALTPAEVVGSGPLRFVADEFVTGQRAVYRKNTDYVPRQEAPNGTTGGKVVNFDRIEWRYLSDPATAATALQTGEIDWWESASFDLLEVLKRDRNVKLYAIDNGQRNMLRFQCGTKPFNNPALRRVVAAALTQSDLTQAVVGSDPAMQGTCFAMYACGVPGVQELGKSLMDTKKDYKALAEEARKAGYNGEKLILIRSVDVPVQAPAGPVVLDALQKIGMNVELLSLDLASATARRASNAPLEEGGWSMFILQAPSAVMANPLAAIMLRGTGTAGFAGNYNDPQLESLIDDWLSSPNDQEQLVRLNTLHQRLWDQMPVVPLGNYKPQTALRADLVDHIEHIIPIPWHLKRAS